MVVWRPRSTWLGKRHPGTARIDRRDTRVFGFWGRYTRQIAQQHERANRFLLDTLEQLLRSNSHRLRRRLLATPKSHRRVDA